MIPRIHEEVKKSAIKTIPPLDRFEDLYVYDGLSPDRNFTSWLQFLRGEWDMFRFSLLSQRGIQVWLPYPKMADPII